MDKNNDDDKDNKKRGKNRRRRKYDKQDRDKTIKKQLRIIGKGRMKKK